MQNFNTVWQWISSDGLFDSPLYGRVVPGSKLTFEGYIYTPDTFDGHVLDLDRRLWLQPVELFDDDFGDVDHERIVVDHLPRKHRRIIREIVGANKYGNKYGHARASEVYLWNMRLERWGKW